MHAAVSLCMQKPGQGIRVFLDSSPSTALRQNLSLTLNLGLSESLAVVNPSDPYHTVPTSHSVGLCAVYQSISGLVVECWHLTSPDHSYVSVFNI